MSLLRRINSALVIAMLWAIVWLPVGVIVGAVLGWMRIPPRTWPEVSFLTTWTAAGALSGVAFAILLAIAERNRTFAELTPRRFVLWGILGGATLPIGSTLIVLAIYKLHLASPALPVFALMAALGGLCGSASLWLARRSPQEPTGR